MSVLPFSLIILSALLHAGWKVVAVFADIMMAIAYGLVLIAMNMTENVSFVVALRQTSQAIDYN